METHRIALTLNQCAAAYKCISPFELRIHLHATISSCATIIVIYLSLRVCVSGKQLNVTCNAVLDTVAAAFRISLSLCVYVCNTITLQRNDDHTVRVRGRHKRWLSNYFAFCSGENGSGFQSKGECEHLLLKNR